MALGHSHRVPKVPVPVQVFGTVLISSTSPARTVLGTVR